MRTLAPLLALSLACLPVAAGEDGSIRALGGQGSAQTGVFGFQWDDDSAVGVRYWFNMTDDEDAVLILTTCVTMDSGNGVYCERHRVVA